MSGACVRTATFAPGPTRLQRLVQGRLGIGEMGEPELFCFPCGDAVGDDEDRFALLDLGPGDGQGGGHFVAKASRRDHVPDPGRGTAGEIGDVAVHRGNALVAGRHDDDDPARFDRQVGGVLGFVGLPEIQVAGMGARKDDIGLLRERHRKDLNGLFHAGPKGRRHIPEEDPRRLAVAVRNGVQDRGEPDPAGDLVHLLADRVVEDAEVGTRRTDREEVRVGRRCLARYPRLDDLRPPGEAADVVRDDAADADFEVGLEDLPVDVDPAAVFRRPQIDVGCGVPEGVVLDRDALDGLRAEFPEDLGVGHEPVGPQGDDDADIAVRNAGGVAFVEENGNDGLGRGWAGDVVGDEHDLLLPADEVPKRGRADRVGEAADDFGLHVRKRGAVVRGVDPHQVGRRDGNPDCIRSVRNLDFPSIHDSLSRLAIAMAAANRIASVMLRLLAVPFPATSKAVPWSTDVRMKGSPTVTFTPSSNPRSLTGICPWSWYMATTMSKSPFAAR